MGFKDIRKEDNKQYRILLDIFQTFILVFNCIFSDSNKNKAEKADEARTIIEKLIYKDYENSQTHKYSVRDIKDMVDKRARRLYKYMEQWQKELMKITPKNANDSIFLNEMIATLEKEMNDLEYVEFDSIVNENITYQKNNVKASKSQLKEYIQIYADMVKKLKSENALELEAIKQNIINTFPEEIYFTLIDEREDFVKLTLNKTGNEYILPIFTDIREYAVGSAKISKLFLDKLEMKVITPQDISKIADEDEDFQGFVINPHSQNFNMDRNASF